MYTLSLKEADVNVNNFISPLSDKNSFSESIELLQQSYDKRKIKYFAYGSRLRRFKKHPLNNKYVIIKDIGIP